MEKMKLILGVGIVILSYIVIRLFLLWLNRQIKKQGLAPKEEEGRKKWKPSEFFRPEELSK